MTLQLNGMTPTRGRFLDPASKGRELRVWRDAVRSWRSEGAPARGGAGFPDPPIIPWCDRLNRISGVCTLQSCSGHRRGRWRSAGHLWLWLTEDMSRRFDERALLLAQQPEIERVYRMYSDWGREVTAVEFRGEEWGRLDASMNVILRFFSSLRAS
jgi:hypothetical protein